ncbi:MAG: S9 family peptidase [Phenylobacterium sp.]|uniref:alpha/beta hydrolase family protein n=1 Tax=Phenylobacterium sp. TaxID=1871053 RepID=UPI001A64166E|nr:prolyl oligopeptidase family serine peptidase [Phenylobacterium sp.]MBL8553994.1 S9 family peptidase [Phenylobacterium sp.]
MVHEVSYGAWPSPWTPELVSTASAFPVYWTGQLEVDRDGAVYALIRRPEEGGRSVVERVAPGAATTITPDGFNLRTTIYEYGGSAFLVRDGEFFFINEDQRWYRHRPGSAPEPITAEGPYRYGAPVLDARRGRIVCIREEFQDAGEPKSTIVAIDVRGDTFGTVLVAGDDFYAWPVLSHDAGRLAWVSWNHPNVPWDVTALRVAQLDAAGSLAAVETVVAEEAEVACDPRFTPSGDLIFMTDRSGWWRPCRWRGGEIEPLCDLERDFARPLWQMGTSDCRVLDDDNLLCVYTEEGMNRLGRLHLPTGELSTLELPFTYFARLEARDGVAYALASSSTIPAAIVRIELETGEHTILRQVMSAEPMAGAISRAQHIHFPSAKGRTGFGFFYPPTNADCRGPEDERPPLLVVSHGGPTGCTNTCFNPGIQFWTSRGFAVFDVNYAGSTGYGRDFRHLLRGGWGVVDVEDHVAAARHLVAEGLVDPERLAVRGWSAGGYNTFAALAFADTFHAGASYFGISDVAYFASQTHKFESRYADYLVGPRDTSEALYRERSPLHSADRITAPLAMFQGERDRITPKNQSELILESLRKRGVPVMYMLFEGEGHGFRRADTNLACLKAELAFYARLFGFRPADVLPPIVIENVDRPAAAAGAV